ncbi:MAG TPA: 4Fe-4S cluster-binding domain-containing protein, partial [Thermodesulfovibrionia bacterium]|nr:4Fe-4S cluster-binding domain-containing protein [Thermodesulfovibrionia bacterium]
MTIKQMQYDRIQYFLNIAAFRKSVLAAGPGLRDTLWLQGCNLNCSGCANQEYRAHVPNHLTNVDRLIAHFRARQEIHGITVSGGEPT